MVHARIRHEPRTWEPLAQVRVEVEDAVGVCEEPFRHTPPVGLGVEAPLFAAWAPDYRPDIAPLVGDEDRLPPALQPAELVKHNAETPHGQDGLAEVEVENVVVIDDAAQEARPSRHPAPDGLLDRGVEIYVI